MNSSASKKVITVRYEDQSARDRIKALCLKKAREIQNPGLAVNCYDDPGSDGGRQDEDLHLYEGEELGDVDEDLHLYEGEELGDEAYYDMRE